MKCSVSHGPARTRGFLFARLHVLVAIAGLSLPLLAGCPGNLEGSGWPSPMVGVTGSGGATGSGGSGTGTGGSGSGTGGASGACDATTMIFPSCVSASCHKPTGPFTPDLSTGALGNLKMQNAVFSTPPCSGQPLVNTADKANSALLKRVQGTSCGPQMPYMMPPLPNDQIQCLVDWVNAQN